MKIYISVDIEGICGTTHWDEVTRGNEEYLEFQKQMTAEVIAACKGAFAAGATEIYIKDAHDTAKNIIAAELPKNTFLIRGWSGHPYVMMQELDHSFDAVLMIGYHSLGGSSGNPLAHTMSNTRVSSVTINGQPASEFLINSYCAMLEKIPVVFVSGDRELCHHARAIIPAIQTVSVKHGVGNSTINLHPLAACEQISVTVQKALSGDLSACLGDIPAEFAVQITYNHCQQAYRNSFFPGATLSSPNTISFNSQNYLEVLKLFLFTL